MPLQHRPARRAAVTSRRRYSPGSSEVTELDNPVMPERPDSTEFGSWPSSWETTEVGSSFRICDTTELGSSVRIWLRVEVGSEVRICDTAELGSEVRIWLTVETGSSASSADKVELGSEVSCWASVAAGTWVRSWDSRLTGSWVSWAGGGSSGRSCRSSQYPGTLAADCALLPSEASSGLWSALFTPPPARACCPAAF